MNVQNIIKVADAIEAGAIPDLGFNMGTWRGSGEVVHLADMSGRGCGTTACVGGWASAILNTGMSDVATGDALGLSEAEQEELFYCASLPGGYLAQAELITPAQAVRCLRHLAATGEVDWPRAMGEAE